MIATMKSFFQPQTSQQMYNRVAGTLVACIAILFVVLLVSRYVDAKNSIYLTDGETVLKLSADNTVTIYKSR